MVPRPSNEKARLRALRSYDILDTPPERAFDDLAKLAALVCGVPIASVTLVDAERKWFKAKVGFDACETPRDVGFCGYTILAEDLLVVRDASADDRFARHPIVCAGPKLRFYAGAPLTTPTGHRIGALAVNDTIVRDLTEEQLEALRAISRQVVDQLELRSALTRSRHEALTDPLTGLGNRRSVFKALETELAHETTHEQMSLMFLDLDGFKRYNDVFGHAAGDALLKRLASRLAKTVAKHGTAYRMGGDEFCVLLRGAAGRSAELTNAVARALSERGEGFEVTTSCGVVALPEEAVDPDRALQLADERMYGQKNSRPGSVRAQTADVINRIVSERTPELHEHVSSVAELAARMGENLSFSRDAIDELVHAAKLHDIGKLAIPDEILEKPGPLSDDEWAFVRSHTLVAERMLNAAPALESIAKIVRSSHERWDGTGYPDGISGDAIPLASRIILLCDSFQAMTSERPYRPSMSTRQALRELVDCSGTQFDPALVAMFSEIVK